MERPMRILATVLLAVGILGFSACQQGAPSGAKEEPKVGAKPEAPKQEPVQAKSSEQQASKPPASKAEKSEVERLRIATVPIQDLTPAYIAYKLGYFKEEGLEVDLVDFGGGAESIPSLFAGKIDICYTAWVSAILARSQNFDVTIVSGNSIARSKPPDAAALMVKGDATYKTPKDLEGKRIAVNNLMNVVWLFGRLTLEKYGVDLNKVTFTEVPFPQMGDALLNNRIDAAVIIEPFQTVLVSSGKGRVLSYVYLEAQPGLEIAGYLATDKWVKEHPVATKKFVSALRRGVEWPNKNDAEYRKYLAEYTKMEPALAQKVITNNYRVSPIDVKSIQTTADLMLKNGMLKDSVDVSKMVYATALEK